MHKNLKEVKRLADHIKMMHNKEELPHECQVCTKVFAIPI